MFEKTISGEKNNNFENKNYLQNIKKIFSILLVSGILATMPNMAFARGHGHHFHINHNNTVHYMHNNENAHTKSNLNKEEGFFEHFLNNLRKWWIFGHGHSSNQDTNQTAKNQRTLQQKLN